MSDNTFPDPIAVLNSPVTIPLPHQPTPHYPIVSVQTMRTLRDDFAIAALQGIMANPCRATWDETDVASFCFRQADAMLKAREVKP